MINKELSCFKVSDTGICPKCKSKTIIKNGFTKNKKQQYQCKSCTLRFIDYYTYNAYRATINKDIVTLTKEGLGIRSTARILQISTTTLLKRIIKIAKGIKNPIVYQRKIYEIDEMRTFIMSKNKLIWLVYALERKTNRVVSFAIGNRTKKTLQNVTNTILYSNPKRVYKDKLIHYKSLLNKNIHYIKQ